MKLHIKTLFLVAFFAFAALGLQAQEKYEYAVLSSTSFYGATLWSGTEVKAIDYNRDEFKVLGMVNMLLKEVKKMEDSGWEMFDVSVSSPAANNFITYTYHFRKKR